MKKNSFAEYQFIDTKFKFEDFIETLENEKVIAVDLESDSMYHFKEKVCLLQIATPKNHVIIDPLQIKDLYLLKPFFSNPEIKKIFHGADYDVRSLYRDFNIEINNLFDTQLACRFLGIKETGLEAVLLKWFNISLDKKYQKKDWSQRPLPQTMITYAAKDVAYLVVLADFLEQELDKKGMLSWVYEECEHLSRVRPVLFNHEPLYLKFKGAGLLGRRSLAILENLLQLRKNIAEKKDKPLFKVFENDSILKIIKTKPVSIQYLEKINALSKKQLHMYGNEIIKAVQTALEIPEKELPVFCREKKPFLSSKVPERVKFLKQWRDDIAKSLYTDSSLICNKSALTMIAVKNPSNIKELKAIEEMKNWQIEAFGKDILAVLKKIR